MRKIVKVKWIDSSSTFGWTDQKRCSDEVLAIESIGFLVHEDKKTLTLASCMGTSAWRSPVTIPKFAIKSKTYIK